MALVKSLAGVNASLRINKNAIVISPSFPNRGYGGKPFIQELEKQVLH